MYKFSKANAVRKGNREISVVRAEMRRRSGALRQEEVKLRIMLRVP